MHLDPMVTPTIPLCDKRPDSGQQEGLKSLNVFQRLLPYLYLGMSYHLDANALQFRVQRVQNIGRYPIGHKLVDVVVGRRSWRHPA